MNIFQIQIEDDCIQNMENLKRTFFFPSSENKWKYKDPNSNSSSSYVADETFNVIEIK